MVFPILVFVVVLGAAAPAPAQLKEIGHASASSNMCGILVVHANSAISAALRDDVLIARTIAVMRTSNLEADSISRRQTMNDLDGLAAQLRDTETHGNGEIKRLRDLAANASDAPQNADLKTFADALGDALSRQAKMSVDLTRVLASLDYQDMRGSVPDPQSTLAAAPAVTGAPELHFAGASAEHASPNLLLSSVAADFQARMSQVQKSEAKAADHSDGAVSGC
jgi:hypothetical protein